MSPAPTARQLAADAEIMRIVMESDDPAAAARQVLDAIAADHLCPVYSWCVARGEHDDHFSTDVTVPCAKEDEGEIRTACFLSFSGSRPFIGFQGMGCADLDATQARQEVAKLRDFADQLEAMASVLESAEATL